MAALLSWRIAAQESRLRKAGFYAVRPRFWYILTAALVALGVNKQLDLQTWFTQFGRQILRAESWMDIRRTLQVIFIGFVCLLGLVVSLAGFIYLRNGLRRYALAWIGLVVIICFVLIRAASFHHVDHLLGVGWPLFKLNHALELSGIAIVIVGTLRAGRVRQVSECDFAVPADWSPGSHP